MPVAPTEPGMVAQLATIFRELVRLPRGWPVLFLSVAIVIVLVGNMIGQVRLNTWNGAFFDALEQRNSPVFFWQFAVFFQIVAVLLALVVAQTFLQELLKIRIRQRLSQTLLDRWLEPGRAYRLTFAGPRGAAPDQRMQEDCRLFSEFTTELGVGILQSTLLLVTFIGVLWGLSSSVVLTIGGERIVIPGYMVWVAIAYAGLGSLLTYFVGRPMIPLNTARYAREADLRFSLVRVNESAEGVALYCGESDERRNLERVLDEVLKATRRLSGALARLTWITSGYGWVALVVPIVAAAPGYFAGSLSFGELMMVVGAFSQVQAALRWFVDNFPKIADWRSAVHRVSMFREAMLSLEKQQPEDQRLVVEPHPEGKLAFENVAISTIEGSTVVEDASAEIEPGERVLITGESGSGKSTLFRAIAGLWPWGQGTIRVPPSNEQMFMPQRPYLPLGTLRAAICYPAAPDGFPNETVRWALGRCGLSDFIESLDREERWDKMLSLGQQQRIAFGRILLHRPKWVFMDEATSALDEESQAAMLGLFDTELQETTILSIAHRPGIEDFHTRTLKLVRTPQGAVLFGDGLAPQRGDLWWRKMLRTWRRRARAADQAS
ncbi:MAG TPA: ABC transporter ATP-binding protein/permease [Beijerinckiaceae bacterium]|nr:ABC transporter ATP-binding protein/permease [Beijerinckiaceae bacterium]